MDGWVSRRALTVFVAACLLALPASAAADQGGIAEFSVPTPNAYPGPITAGPDDTMWFTESGATQIGEITPTGEVTEYPVAPEGTLPGSITLGPDGNLWFTENLGGYIGRMTPTGTLTKFSGTPGASVAIPLGITAGPGGDLWFTQSPGIGQVGVMTTSGATQLFTPSPAIEPDDITVGPNGNLWFSSGLYGRIGEITPTGTATEFQLPIGSGGGITTGPDGNVWFTGYSDVIGEMTPGGILTLYQTPTEQSDPSDIVAGPDGNLWFTEYDADQIGRITPGGTVTEYRIPTPDAGPVGIAEGPNGNLWFTESRADQIGEIVFAQPSITSASSASVTAGHALGFTVTTTAFPPPALSEIGNLPNGVQFTDNGDGTATLSGTPSSSAAGTYTFTIDAGNMIGSDATQTFTLTVTAPPATVTMSTASTTSPTSTVSSTPVKPVAAAPVLPACASDPTDVHGRALGGLELGMSRAAAARAYPRSKERGPDSQEFFCVGTNGLTADFASNRLLRTLDRAWRARLSGRIALISTTSPEYSVDGLHVRDFLAEAAARLPLGLPLRLGGAAWYLVPVGDVTLVLKVRDRTVEELGIADRQLTATPAARRAFLASFA